VNANDVCALVAAELDPAAPASGDDGSEDDGPVIVVAVDGAAADADTVNGEEKIFGWVKSFWS
jgi:hypothetical protein